MENVELFSILVGHQSLDLGRFSGDLIPINSILIHDEFRPIEMNDDIALLFTAYQLDYSDAIQSIQLPNWDILLTPGSLAMFSGWGSTEFPPGQYSNELKEIEIYIIEQSICEATYTTLLMDGKMCAGVMEGGRGACAGDIGGPLVINDTLIGIFSWGIGCALPSFPSVFVNVAYHLGWIEENIRNRVI